LKKKISFKIKTKDYKRIWAHNLGILGFNEDDLKTFRPKVWEILKFGWFFVIENSIK
jgi:hypothetical protein